ncbi:MAG: molybdenum cofactor biosynthesis protein MoaE [Actinomycetota bacterium]|nr:molybdenum cofactor biosynthesis protein MoaE [Actinomycetota bacterium]
MRDHADGRDDVVALTYEAYEEKTIDSFAAIADELRNRWPDVGRVLIWHRIGRLELCEVSVIVAVSSPHRPVAFEAARFAIDALKVSSPIWKHEEWSEGSDWGTGASPIERPSGIASEPN